MATIEERIAYRKAKEMDIEELRSFLKGVDTELLLDELRRRTTITEKINEMAGTLGEIIKQRAS